MADYLNIAGRIRTTASDGVSMEASEVFDESLEKSQSEINNDVNEIESNYLKQGDGTVEVPDVSFDPYSDTIHIEKQVLSEGQQAQVLSNIRDTNANNDGKMGYKVLQPETKATFQSQITQPNTIYEIRDVFDLGGTQETPVTFTMPTNCTLKFNGGLINNGEIIGTNSTINSPVCKIFGSNVTIKGTWSNTFAYADWFDSIQKAVDNFYIIKLSPRSYDLTQGIELRAFSHIIGADAKLNFSIGNNSIAIKMGSQSKVENCYIRLVRGVGENRIGVLIDADYINITRGNTDGYYSSIRRTPQLYMLENLEIENPESPNTGAYEDTAISVRTVNGGFWGNIARNIRLFGSFRYGIDIDSNAGTLATDNGWLTNLTFRDFIFANCLIGVNIHKTNQNTDGAATSSRLTRSLFDNFHFQASVLETRNRYKELGIISRFAQVNYAEGISFTNWYVSDWANDETAACASTSLIHINSNTSFRILIDTSLWDSKLFEYYKAFSWDNLNNASSYNCPQIDVINTHFAFNMGNYIDFTNETQSRIRYLVEILPPGRYYVHKNNYTAFVNGLGLSSFDTTETHLYVEIEPYLLMRQITVYGNISSNQQPTMARANYVSRTNDGSSASLTWRYYE